MNQNKSVERARTTKKTYRNERAILGDNIRNPNGERATKVKETIFRERAVLRKKTLMDERAIRLEKTEIGERAKRIK